MGAQGTAGSACAMRAALGKLPAVLCLRHAAPAVLRCAHPGRTGRAPPGRCACGRGRGSSPRAPPLRQGQGQGGAGRPAISMQACGGVRWGGGQGGSMACSQAAPPGAAHALPLSAGLPPPGRSAHPSRAHPSPAGWAPGWRRAPGTAAGGPPRSQCPAQQPAGRLQAGGWQRVAAGRDERAVGGRWHRDHVAAQVLRRCTRFLHAIAQPTGIKARVEPSHEQRGLARQARQVSGGKALLQEGAMSWTQ